MAKRRGHRKTKRAAEIGTATAIVLGLGAAVGGIVLYNHFKAPATPTTGTPAQITPNGTGVQTALSPAR
jgi:hypothetical protein